jgi:carbonic anhydrase/acetyltransferase-like protein (isoleucine patch superfamily)
MIYSYKDKIPKIIRPAFIADSSDIIGEVEIAENASVWFNAVIRGDVNFIKIGARTNIQDGSILHVSESFPLNVGEGVTVGHNVVLHACTVGDHSLLGMGSVILDGAIIGKNVLVAAGSVVLQNVNVPAGVLVAGIPAKIIRELNAEECKQLEESANNYILYAKSFQNIKRVDKI